MGYADLMSSQGLVIPTIGVGAGPLCVIFAYERRNTLPRERLKLTHELRDG